MNLIYNQAHNFKLAAERCNIMIELPKSIDGDFQWLLIPYIVNASLACELYLKSIIEGGKKEPPKTHKLYELFSLISKEIQDEIKKGVENESFDDNLKQASDYFIKWRYVYEEIKKNEPFNANLDFIRKLLNSLDSVAKNINEKK